MVIEASDVAELVAGRYQLGARLGAGGMAVVYRARDEVLHREVAIKLFGPAADADHPDRIQTEMRTLASLSHPGLVSVYDAGTEEQVGGFNRAFLVMQLIDGPTLAECIKDGPMGPDRVREVGAQVAEALAYMHGKGVVHRDIKPANIILDADGCPHLTDFGVARTVGAERHTATGMTIGTAAYLSPEQVTGGELTPAADVYALGLTLLEAMTGTREYPGAIAESAVARLTRQPVIPDLPEPWPGLLEEMTAIDPAQRPLPQEVAAVLRTPDTTATQVVPEAAAAPPPTQLFSRPGPADGDAQTVLVQQHRRDPMRLPLVLGGIVAAIVVVGLALSSVGNSSSGKAPSAPVNSPAPNQLTTDLDRLHQLVTR